MARAAKPKKAARSLPPAGPPRKRGRPSGYRAEFAAQAREMCEGGATDFEVARALGTTDRNLYRWAIEYPEFRQALKLGKDGPDDRVVRSLFEKATGYRIITEKIFLQAGSREPIRVPFIEHVAPDTTACIFWLKNRRVLEWRDRQATTTEDGDETVTIKVEGGLPAEIEAPVAPTVPADVDPTPDDNAGS